MAPPGIAPLSQPFTLAALNAARDDEERPSRRKRNSEPLVKTNSKELMVVNDTAGVPMRTVAAPRRSHRMFRRPDHAMEQLGWVRDYHSAARAKARQEHAADNNSGVDDTGVQRPNNCEWLRETTDDIFSRLNLAAPEPVAEATGDRVEVAVPVGKKENKMLQFSPESEQRFERKQKNAVLDEQAEALPYTPRENSTSAQYNPSLAAQQQLQAKLLTFQEQDRAERKETFDVFRMESGNLASTRDTTTSSLQSSSAGLHKTSSCPEYPAILLNPKEVLTTTTVDALTETQKGLKPVASVQKLLACCNLEYTELSWLKGQLPEMRRSLSGVACDRRQQQQLL